MVCWVKVTVGLTQKQSLQIHLRINVFHEKKQIIKKQFWKKYLLRHMNAKEKRNIVSQKLDLPRQPHFGRFIFSQQRIAGPPEIVQVKSHIYYSVC